jgi:hypothetical protein
MTKMIRFLAVLAVLFGFTMVGCSSPCDTMAKKVCGDPSSASCKSFMDKELRGPNGKRMTGAQGKAACKMIVDDDKVLGLYKKRYESKYKK